jgi:hypothetical protein
LIYLKLSQWAFNDETPFSPTQNLSLRLAEFLCIFQAFEEEDHSRHATRLEKIAQGTFSSRRSFQFNG